jgi:hypothetical protein
MRTLALSPTFWKGIAVTVAGVILFVGSVYVLLTAIFGLRMGYLVLAVSLFGWMIIISALWVFGATFFGSGTPKYQGPRGTEAHWQVYAASSGQATSARFPETNVYPGSPWRAQSAATTSAADTVKTSIQQYMAASANRRLGVPEEIVDEINVGIQPPEGRFVVTPDQFVVEDIRFATSGGGTFLSSGVSSFANGGPGVTVFLYHDKGNVPAYSWAFLLASLFGFVVHVPFLDRAERKRKEFLTGGTAPPWYGPA